MKHFTTPYSVPLKTEPNVNLSLDPRRPLDRWQPLLCDNGRIIYIRHSEPDFIDKLCDVGYRKIGTRG